MKVLFLEDDENRIRKARQGFIGHHLFVARTAQEAITLLESIQFDLASLDHDLGGQQMAESDENSGYAVAKFLRDGMDSSKRPRLAIVHSFNPVGAEKMLLCLEDCNYQAAAKIFLDVQRALFDTPQYWAMIGSGE